MYNYTLSASQAAALYQSPAASWALDGGTPPVCSDDATGDGYSATPAGGVTYPADKYFGTVADFDGTSGYAETASPVVDTTGSYSVSAWVNMPSIPTHNATIVSQQGNVNSSFTCSSITALTARRGGTSRYPPWMPPRQACTTSSVRPGPAQANTWTQLTGVFNAATGTGQLFVNGQLADSTAAADFASTGPLDIGRGKWAGNMQDYFPGEVTNVQVFPYALTAGAAQALYSRPDTDQPNRLSPYEESESRRYHLIFGSARTRLFRGPDPRQACRQPTLFD